MPVDHTTHLSRTADATLIQAEWWWMETGVSITLTTPAAQSQLSMDCCCSLCDSCLQLTLVSHVDWVGDLYNPDLRA
ncbi:hypothetical protein ACROYT_G039527 [Oculina patagonica]